MSQYYNQMRSSHNEARSRLQERLAREDMGDEAYEKAASYADERAFKIFGIVFIALFAAVILGLAWLGY